MFKEKFGIEIEFTGITRNKASKVAAEVINGSISETRDYYDTKEIKALVLSSTLDEYIFY